MYNDRLGAHLVLASSTMGMSSGPKSPQVGNVTLPETNSKFTPESRPGQSPLLRISDIYSNFPSIFRGEHVMGFRGNVSSLVINLHPSTDSPTWNFMQETSEGSDLDVMEEACERGRVPWRFGGNRRHSEGGCRHRRKWTAGTEEWRVDRWFSFACWVIFSFFWWFHVDFRGGGGGGWKQKKKMNLRKPLMVFRDVSCILPKSHLGDDPKLENRYLFYFLFHRFWLIQLATQKRVTSSLISTTTDFSFSGWVWMVKPFADFSVVYESSKDPKTPRFFSDKINWKDEGGSLGLS